MSQNIQIDFEAMTQLRRVFAEKATQVDRMRAVIVQSVEDLRAGEWVGQGASRFYVRADNEVLPALQCLVQALQKTDEFFAHIVNCFQEAEQQASDELGRAGGGEPAPTSGANTGVNSGAATGGGYVYNVRAGDTLWDIGQRHDLTVDELLAANPDITDRNLIYPGQEINIPGAEAPGAVPPATPTSPPGGNPELWSDWVGKTSNRMQGWGCVAYVLDSAYLPWVTPSASPGNAIDFLSRAETWAAANPDHGVTIDRVPRDGAIAVYPNMGNGYGHVGIVDGANGNNYKLNSGNTWHNGNTVPQGNWYDNHGNMNGVNVDNMRVETGGRNDVWFIHLPWNQV